MPAVTHPLAKRIVECPLGPALTAPAHRLGRINGQVARRLRQLAAHRQLAIDLKTGGALGGRPKLSILVAPIPRQTGERRVVPLSRRGPTAHTLAGRQRGLRIEEALARFALSACVDPSCRPPRALAVLGRPPCTVDGLLFLCDLRFNAMLAMAQFGRPPTVAGSDGLALRGSQPLKLRPLLRDLRLGLRACAHTRRAMLALEASPSLFLGARTGPHHPDLRAGLRVLRS